jgi:phage/conjugal plasmid C-4 type zinc finger TraR family protein
MAVGWAKDGAEQDQISVSLEDEIARVRANLPTGESLTHCENCGEEIAVARRLALPGVRFCVPCQTELDKEQKVFNPYNRRASKDSQLK